MCDFMSKLQWVHGPITVVMPRVTAVPDQCGDVASMGPRSDNRGYDIGTTGPEQCRLRFNGSTVREPWLCRGLVDGPACRRRASMGPRSRTVVMPTAAKNGNAACIVLQWVHGPRTVVMLSRRATQRSRRSCFNGSTVREPWLCQSANANADAAHALQWVHGRRTVVMLLLRGGSGRQRLCFNGSTVREPWLCRASDPRPGHRRSPLQWVHGPRTVVMIARKREHWEANPASMGPRSENRGYVWQHGANVALVLPASMGPRSRTVVMHIVLNSARLSVTASMGPRSENRGYAGVKVTSPKSGQIRFNGSTVREPWLCPARGVR